jgi:hypothetical protein
MSYSRQVGCIAFSMVKILATRVSSGHCRWLSPNRGGGGDARPQTLRGMPTPSFSVVPVLLGEVVALPIKRGIHPGRQ